MPLPPAFLDELRNRLPLSEVVMRRVTLSRAGREFKGCCPFHNEKTPSFYVNDQKGFFHCFGCGAHGDVIGFVMRHDRLAFPEAIEQLSAQAGLEVPRLSHEEVEQAKQQKTLHQVCEATCAWFEKQLFAAKGRAALDYLHGRGLSDDAIARFRLGYAPQDGGLLITHLKAQGFELAQMMDVGLVRQSEEGERSYSFFRDRVMFPVTDKRGRVVAFGGRIMSGDGPKYINSPDHPLFHKGKLLYSLARAREAAPRGAPLIVVEGYMDVIALIEAGFPAAVAPLGTALTESQMEELWKCGGTGGDPILCFDGDNAGQRAAARAVERIMPLLGASRTVRIAFLPQGQDPDDLIKGQGPRAMQTVLDQAIPLIDMLWKLETDGKALATPEARAGVKAGLDQRIGQIADATVQAYYRSELKSRLDEAFGWGRTRQTGKFAKKPEISVRRSLPPDPSSLRQRLIIAALLRHPVLFERLGERLVELGLTGPLDNLWQAVVTTLETSPDLDPAGLQRHICAQGFADDIDQLLNEKSPLTRMGSDVEKVERELYGWITAERLEQMRAELVKLRNLEISEMRTIRIAALQREILEAEAAALPGDEGTA
jgi:DNA primase